LSLSKCSYLSVADDRTTKGASGCSAIDNEELSLHINLDERTTWKHDEALLPSCGQVVLIFKHKESVVFAPFDLSFTFQHVNEAPPIHPLPDVVLDMRVLTSMPVKSKTSLATFFTWESLTPWLKETPLFTSSTK
jgi:hypothetical protein